MPLQNNGTIKLSQLQAEFGGTNPIKMSEYLRGGSFVPATPNALVNNDIPTNTTNGVSLSEYYSTSKTTIVTYEIIGGGGAGGFGVEDGGEGFRGTFGPAGVRSRITGTGVPTITADGGRGGENCKNGRGSPGGDGEASFYGIGGAGGALNSAGGNAPTDSYGSGGGGGGGDDGSYTDSGGCSGEGGQAGTRITGSFTVPFGTTINVDIGAGGVAEDIGYKGGNGRRGYCKISYNGIQVVFTSDGSRVIQ